ncbi:unnamed protein product [Xylocopa violacea]|uniref:Protein kinase domain-containing protein n=1 Tax=Xylocopa violacea TaxID=135666 RepID=A0ABP1PBF1_XYLVO
MALYPNFSRVFRFNKFFETKGEKWQRKGYAAPIQFNPSLAGSVNNLVNSKRAIKAILIHFYKPQLQGHVYKNDLLIKDTKDASFFDVILIVARIFVIGFVVTGLAIAYLVTRVTHGHVFPMILRKSIEFLGPIFIKFGQWVSTRKDLFPEDICYTLSKLQRSVSSHSWIYTKQLLKAVYGSNWRNVFVKFEHEVPIGSGCCAQVYKAWVDLNAQVEVSRKPQIPLFIQIAESLKLGSLVTIIGNYVLDNGISLAKLYPNYFTRRKNKIISERTLNDNVCESQHCNDQSKLQPVAVKVLHPGIRGQLRRDLFIMRTICKYATYIVPQLQWLSLTDCIDEFSQIMENQVDMNLEAANLIRFSKNFSEKKDVVFPQPYSNFTQCEVLVESFHEGSPISDYLDNRDTKLQERLAKLGIKTILKMVFSDNFIHCDLHPGNILVQTNREPTGKISAWFSKFIDCNYLSNYPRLIILDCGLVVSLNDQCRQNLRNVFRSVLMGNGELAAEYMLEHSPRLSADPDGFKTAIKNIVDSHFRSDVNVTVSTVVTELFSAMVRHKVKQDGSFSSVILSMVVVEGLGRSLDPNIDIFTEVVPFVFTSITVYDD